MSNSRKVLWSLPVSLIAWTASQPSAAEPYPTRNITFVVPFAAGGVADVIARIVAQKLDERTGWKIIVENRGGAGGNIGAHMVSVAEMPKARQSILAPPAWVRHRILRPNIRYVSSPSLTSRTFHSSAGRQR